MNNKKNNLMDQEKDRARIITLTAFLIGFSLTDVLDTTEQGAVGNFFMLVGQTLCTNAAENFRRKVKNSEIFGKNNSEKADVVSNPIDVLKRTQEVFNEEIDKLK